MRLFSMESYAEAGASGIGNAPQTPTPAPSVGKPPVVSRASWGARPPKTAYNPHKPKRLTQHHTAGRKTSTLQESLKEVRFIQDFHQNGRGWNDVGYHFLVDSAGRIFQGRPENVVGAHVGGKNKDNVGVSFLGNYHPPVSHQPTAAQLAAVRDLGKWLRTEYQVDLALYKGHRDLGATSCPGDLVYGWMDRVRDSFDKAQAALSRLKPERWASYQALISAGAAFSY